MTDKVQKIREEVERLKGWNNNVRNSTRHMTLQEEDFNRGKHSSYLEILDFIDSLQEEPKKCMYSKDDFTDEDRKVLCDGCKEECKYNKSDDFTKALAECISQAQCNVVDPMVLAEIWKDELIKLAKSKEPASEEWIKELRTKLDSLSKEDFKKVFDKYAVDFNEEPVSEDLEEAANAYAVTVYNNYLDNPKAFENIDADTLNEDAFKAGAKWQKTKDESTTEDLGEYINELSKQFQEVSFAKLSRIAVRVAQWQKQQIKKAMDLGEPPYLISVEQAYYRTLKLLEE